MTAWGGPEPGLTVGGITVAGMSNHVQKAFLFLLGLILEHGTLNAVHDLFADLLGIRNLLQEACILFDSGNAYRTVRKENRTQ